MSQPEPKQDLACLVNGHTPPPEHKSYELIVLKAGVCQVCERPMHGSMMWAGMKWKFTWRAL